MRSSRGNELWFFEPVTEKDVLREGVPLGM
jgi:hypothetical protein